jgi:hypothetical protein
VLELVSQQQTDAPSQPLEQSESCVHEPGAIVLSEPPPPLLLPPLDPLPLPVPPLLLPLLLLVEASLAILVALSKGVEFAAEEPQAMSASAPA